MIRECLAGRSHRLVVNEINSGSTFRQWDRGVSIARAEFVWIAESDDVAEITFLERLVAALDQGEAAYAYSQSLCIDAESCVFGNIKGWTDDYSPHLWASRFPDGRKLLLRELLGNLVCHPKCKCRSVQTKVLPKSFLYHGGDTINRRLSALG